VTPTAERAAAWRERVVQIQAGLAYHQRAIEEMVYRLYGIPDHEHRAIEASPDGAAKETAEASGDDEEDAEELPAPPRVDQRALAVDLLFFAVGCAFGRWDVRASFEPALAPKLNSPFDPLPVCSPGMLIGPDGLPATRARIVSETWLRARPNVITLPPEGVVDQATIPAADYPLRIAWHGILVDDEGHEEDIAHRVRQVLSLLFRGAGRRMGARSLRRHRRSHHARVSSPPKSVFHRAHSALLQESAESADLLVAPVRQA